MTMAIELPTDLEVWCEDKTPEELRRLHRLHHDALHRAQGDIVDVRRFGVRGDGITDDTASIQQAVRAAEAAGGGVVWFPPGVYGLTLIDQHHAFTVPSHVTLRGAGSLSTLKLLDRQGNYHAVIEAELLSHHVTVEHLTICLNNSHNPITRSEDLSPTARRAAFAVVRGADITIRHCRIYDADSFNVLHFSQCQRVTVAHNRLDDIGTSPVFHDLSAVLFSGRQLRCYANTVDGIPAGLGARTALEAHGQDIHLHHNTVQNFLMGCIVGGAGTAGDGITCSHNALRDVQRGVMIWSQMPVTDLNIMNNRIHLNAAMWDGMWSAGWRATNGVLLHVDSTESIQGLRIEANTITHAALPEPFRASDKAGAGLNLARASIAADRDWKITDNIISDAMASAIRLRTSVQGTHIRANSIRQSCRIGAILDDSRRVGIELAEEITLASVTDNITVDSMANTLAGLTPDVASIDRDNMTFI